MIELGLLSDLIGVGTFVCSLVAALISFRTRAELRHERERLTAPVFVALVSGRDRKVLPLELTRAELTRAELLGRIGMMPMRQEGRRFGLGFLATPAFLRALRTAQDGRGPHTIEIPCTQEELEQFAL